MVIGLTIWGQRISPVFDSARKLLVATVQDSRVITKRYVMFKPAVPLLLSEKLIGLKIDVVICGAISTEPANLIDRIGIKCIPFISGYADDILESYIRGEMLTTKYSMPGCGNRLRGYNYRRTKRQKHRCTKT